MKDHWDQEVWVDFTWAMRDENQVASDSCLSLQLGGEFHPDTKRALFYESDLPELRRWVALLARHMRLQEEGAAGHGRRNKTEVDFLVKTLEGLIGTLREIHA